ncbi:hypothetical protein ABKN59_009409 [Abortiporus biennis]
MLRKITRVYFAKIGRPSVSSRSGRQLNTIVEPNDAVAFRGFGVQWVLPRQVNFERQKRTEMLLSGSRLCSFIWESR